MPRLALSLALLVLTVITGCRREDLREMSVEIPGLSPSNQTQVVEILAKYGGIRHESYRWDFERKTLTLKYDSMQIAESNIRYAIDEKGIKVKFPVKTDERAGH